MVEAIALSQFHLPRRKRGPGWVLLLSAVAFAACGSTERGSTGSASTGSASTGGDPIGVACDDAVDGDPCSVQGERCGPLDGYGCAKSCDGTSWSVTCVERPTCENSTIEQLGACTPSAGLRCGPFEIESACGDVSAMAVCAGFGWYYELPCDPPCEALDESACAETIGCAWVVSCDSELLEELEPGCRDLPPLPTTCESASCPEGTTCVETSVNPFNLAAGECGDGGGTTMSFCVES